MGNIKTSMATFQKINAFIIDDCDTHAQNLYNDLSEQPEIGNVKMFSSCSEATLPILEHQPDVIFLDVEMPECSGFDFFESINSKLNFPLRVVFYSAFSKYVLDALRHEAFDFLLKPYKISELRTIIERLMDNKPSSQIGSLQTKFPIQKKMAVQTVSKLMLLTIEEVLHLQYSRTQRAWLITLTDGTTHRLHQNTTAEDLLALHPSLARVSQGDIVNLTYLTAIENNTQRCRFCSPFEEIEIYASRRNFAKLKEKFELI